MPLLTQLRIIAATATLLGSPASAQDPVVNFFSDHADMAAAVLEARSHLDFVLARLVGDDDTIHPALNLKASFPLENFDVEAEVLWVDGLSKNEDGSFSGTLANAPAYMPGHELGDPVTFERAQIADWSVLSTDGRMFGHFTTRVLIQTLPESEASALRDLLSVDPIPEAWR